MRPLSPSRLPAIGGAPQGNLVDRTLLNMDPIVFRNIQPSPSVYTFAYGL